MKKKLKVLASILTLSMAFTGCSNKAETSVLKVGIMQGKSEIPVIIAKEKGFFDEVGLNVEITSFQGPNYRDAAVQAKEVDTVVTDIMTVLTYNQSGNEMIMTSDMNEDFKLIAAAGQEINSPADFNGKKVIVAKNYLTNYVMDVIAKNNNITYIEEIIPQIPLRMEALKNGLVGGSVLGEPQASMLIKDGVKIIGDVETDYGIEIGAIAFNKEYVEKNAENIKKFYKAYNKAIDYLNSTNPDEYIAIVENYGISSDIADYLKTEEGKYEYAKDFSKEQFDNVLAWTKEKGLITSDYNYENLTNFKYIK